MHKHLIPLIICNPNSLTIMNWRLKLFTLIPNFLKRIGCQMLRRFGYDPDAWLENFLREHKGD
ncbi:MAG: hypothetical protein OXN25_16525 [Candidatus Poribacteria bacterium]|nr:hypothetical protein [Candidatus Poribacteria bacterium]MYK16970.1 hypothetical protein [Candidatus Poribacteria bacterium]